MYILLFPPKIRIKNAIVTLSRGSHGNPVELLKDTVARFASPTGMSEGVKKEERKRGRRPSRDGFGTHP